MNEVIELALNNGLLMKSTNLDLCPSYLDKSGSKPLMLGG